MKIPALAVAMLSCGCVGPAALYIPAALGYGQAAASQSQAAQQQQQPAYLAPAGPNPAYYPAPPTPAQVASQTPTQTILVSQSAPIAAIEATPAPSTKSESTEAGDNALIAQSAEEPESAEPEPAPEAPPPLKPRKISAAEREAVASRKKEREERTAAAKAANTERERQARAAAEEAEATFCGEAPTRSAWDGVYSGLKDAVKSAANDPDSVEFVGCTDLVKKHALACWVTVCRFRAKNAFGAKVLATKAFSKTHLGWSSLGD